MNWKEAHRQIKAIHPEITTDETTDGHINFRYKGRKIAKMRKAGKPPCKQYVQNQIRNTILIVKMIKEMEKEQKEKKQQR